MLKIRFFTLGQFPQEEKWLEEEARKGNILRRSIIPCFYLFRQEKPQNLIYRFDFIPDHSTKEECISLYKQYGWTYISDINSFLLFVHPEEAGAIQPELFSTAASRLAMVERILRRRMYPLLGILAVMVLLLIVQIARSAPFDSIALCAGCVLVIAFVDLSCLFDLLRIQKRIRAAE